MLPPRAYVFLGLNGIRILSIIGLLLVFSSSILVMVNDIKGVNAFMSARQAASVDPVTGNATTTTDAMLDCDYIEGTTVPNQPAGVFWAVLNRLLIIFQVIALILSEVGWPDAFFRHFFPVLSSEFGLGALGVFECLIGAAVLSHHVDDFALVSAFFLFAIGCLNIFAGLIFREKAKGGRSITFWRESKKSVLPVVSGPVMGGPAVFRPTFTHDPPSFANSRFSGHSADHDEKASMESASIHGKGPSSHVNWGSASDKKGGLLIGRPVELTVPPEAAPPYGRAGPSFASASGGQAI